MVCFKTAVKKKKQLLRLGYFGHFLVKYRRPHMEVLVFLIQDKLDKDSRSVFIQRHHNKQEIACSEEQKYRERNRGDVRQKERKMHLSAKTSIDNYQ